MRNTARLSRLRTWTAILLLGAMFLTACGAENSPAEFVQPTMTAAPDPNANPTAEPTVEIIPDPGPDEPFYFGVDLSYVNEMDDCGAVYRQKGAPVDAFELFSQSGANLVRARLWHNPDWTDYSTLPDIERTFARAEAAGMNTLLDFHYSDDWADPGTQNIPAAWQDLSEDELPDAVYAYTFDTLMNLWEQGLMPDFIQVGNETNSGMLKQIMDVDWPRDARLFNAGIQAVRDVAEQTKTNPKIILHVAQPENTDWWFRNAIANGITDFDIIGLSYYPQWSAFSISDLGAHITYLRQTFAKEVMVVETAYPWTLDAAEETADNILYQGIRGYPISVEGQRQYMIDVTQNLISNGGLGVVFWEPAWVSTSCTTRWGQGSHWENVAVFDFQNDNEVHAGIEFLSYPYLFPEALVDGEIDAGYGAALIEDPAADNLDAVPHLDLLSVHGRADETSIFLALTISGNIFANPWGTYRVYLDTTGDGQGADIDPGKHPVTAADPYQPEFILDISALDRKGTVLGVYDLYAWDGEEWQTLSLTGGKAVDNGSPSVIEIQIPKALLGDPDVLNLAVVSLGRGRIHTAGDILGLALSPADWEEPVVLDSFAKLDLTP